MSVVQVWIQVCHLMAACLGEPLNPPASPPLPAGVRRGAFAWSPSTCTWRPLTGPQLCSKPVLIAGHKKGGYRTKHLWDKGIKLQCCPSSAVPGERAGSSAGEAAPGVDVFPSHARECPSDESLGDSRTGLESCPKPVCSAVSETI